MRQLVVEGLYDAQSRLDLPAVPLAVGLVTSVGSAAWHDVTDELARSGFGFRIVACDTRVQGDWAADMVAAAIRTLGARPLDVVLVVRGGGARADLATFDSAGVARAIAECPVPVITGLGHEVDRSVADEVARLALKTPTACAAELVGRVSAFRAAAERAWAAIGDEAQTSVARARRSLGSLAGHAARQTRSSVGLAEARLASHAQRLPRDARRSLETAEVRLVRSGERARGDAARSLAASSGSDHLGRSAAGPTGAVLGAGRGRRARRSGSPSQGARSGGRVGPGLEHHPHRGRRPRPPDHAAGGRRRRHHHPGRRPGPQPSRGDASDVSDATESTGVRSSPAGGGGSEPGYAEALTELEGIFRELEGDTVDIDHLGERVRRAATLIRLCRSRIDAARMEIEQVVAELDPDA